MMATLLPTWQAISGLVDSRIGDLINLLSGGELDAVSAALETTSEALGATAATLQDLQVLLAIDDPISSLLGTLGAAATTVISDFRKTGVYFLPVAPTRLTDVLRPYSTGTAMFDAALSLSDPLDSQRPDLGAEGAYAGAVVLAGASNWPDFLRVLEAIDNLFGRGLSQWKRFADLRLRYQSREVRPRGERQSAGTPWDWNSLTVGDISGRLGAALREIERFLAAAAGYTSAFGALAADAAAILAERVAALAELLTAVAELVAFLAALRDLLVGSHWLPLASDRGGSTELAGQLVSARNPPPYKFAAGFVLVAAGPNPYADFDLLRDLFGFHQDNLDRYYDRARARFEAVG